MKDKNGWELFDKHFQSRLAKAGRTELNRLQVRDACECVLYSIHRIVLQDKFDISKQEYK